MAAAAAATAVLPVATQGEPLAQPAQQPEAAAPAAAAQAGWFDGCSLGGCGAIFSHLRTTVAHNVHEQPLFMLVTAVVFALFGISQVLPTILAAIVISIPLLTFAYFTFEAIYSEREMFAAHLAREVRGYEDALQAKRSAHQNQVAKAAAPVQTETRLAE